MKPYDDEMVEVVDWACPCNRRGRGQIPGSSRIRTGATVICNACGKYTTFTAPYSRSPLFADLPAECPSCGGNGVIGTATMDCPDPWHVYKMAALFEETPE